MLRALSNLPNKFTTSEVSAQAPRLYLFNSDTGTQIHEDFPNVLDLKLAVVSPPNHTGLSKALAISIGHALGRWLRSFHTWTGLPDQSSLQKEISGNKSMRDLKYRIYYDFFIGVIENFPDVLEGHRQTLEAVKDMATKEFEKTEDDERDGDDWGIIHGDFWSGK
jgi:hypothetical protein